MKDNKNVLQRKLNLDYRMRKRDKDRCSRKASWGYTHVVWRYEEAIKHYVLINYIILLHIWEEIQVRTWRNILVRIARKVLQCVRRMFGAHWEVKVPMFVKYLVAVLHVLNTSDLDI